MSAHRHQRELPSVGSRRLGKHWRPRRAEVLELERHVMVLQIENAELRARLNDRKAESSA